jgi:hypothetical protein
MTQCNENYNIEYTFMTILFSLQKDSSSSDILSYMKCMKFNSIQINISRRFDQLHEINYTLLTNTQHSNLEAII